MAVYSMDHYKRVVFSCLRLRFFLFSFSKVDFTQTEIVTGYLNSASKSRYYDVIYNFIAIY